MINEFNQPLIVYKESTKSYYFYRDQKHLGLCNYQAYRKGFQNDMLIFTTYGNTYKILRAKISRYRILPLFFWLFASPIVELEFDFIPAPNPLSFEEFKRKLINYFRHDSYFENVGLTRQIINKTNNAKNYQELSGIFEFIK